MTDTRFQEDWRAAEPLPDFARRVLLELERRERAAAAIDSPRSGGRRHTSPLVVLGLAALLISGAAAASLGRSWRPTLESSVQEGAPIQKGEREAPRVLLVSAPAPMEPEKAKERPVVRARQATHDVAPEAPTRPAPIHYPACHCSSGAVICSCVD